MLMNGRIVLNMLESKLDLETISFVLVSKITLKNILFWLSYFVSILSI